MDFREILLIASKAQGVNNVPVSISRGAIVGDPGLQVPSVWSLELQESAHPLQEKKDLDAVFFFFFSNFWTCTSGYRGVKLLGA